MLLWESRCIVHVEKKYRTVCACVSLSGGSGDALYKWNERLDKKISLFSGDITKLEIDAVVNAGMWV